MQPVHHISIDEVRNGARTALNQQPLQSPLEQSSDDGAWRNKLIGLGQTNNIDTRRTRRIAGPHDNALCAIVSEAPRPHRQTSARVDNDARRMPPGDTPHIQHRIVGQHRAYPDDDGVNACPQPVQVIKRCAPVDPSALTGGRGDTSVQRLPELRHNKRAIRTGHPDRMARV